MYFISPLKNFFSCHFTWKILVMVKVSAEKIFSDLIKDKLCKNFFASRVRFLFDRKLVQVVLISHKNYLMPDRDFTKEGCNILSFINENRINEDSTSTSPKWIGDRMQGIVSAVFEILWQCQKYQQFLWLVKNFRIPFENNYVVYPSVLPVYFALHAGQVNSYTKCLNNSCELSFVL